jgi:hypothetical protein
MHKIQGNNTKLNQEFPFCGVDITNCGRWGSHHNPMYSSDKPDTIRLNSTEFENYSIVGYSTV